METIPSHLIEKMAQRIQSVFICEACHHPREAHVEWIAEEALPLSFPIPLRAHCGVRGCSCRNYAGLLWEKASRDR